MNRYYPKHIPNKRFGQNFLQDSDVISRIIAAIGPNAQAPFIEIGPGLGALTVPLLKSTGKLTVIELDRTIIPLLEIATQGLGHLTIIQQDALKVDFAALCPPGQQLHVVGNLPYNISTPLIFHLLDYADKINHMTFMLQKEVVDRMSAPPGSKTYGRLSVMVQYYAKALHLFDVPPEAFDPKPKVDSAIVRLTPYETKPFVAHDEARFAVIVREAFNHRRKTLNNALKHYVSAEAFEMAGISLKARAEELSVESFVRLANGNISGPTQIVTPEGP